MTDFIMVKSRLFVTQSELGQVKNRLENLLDPVDFDDLTILDLKEMRNAVRLQVRELEKLINILNDTETMIDDE